MACQEQSASIRSARAFATALLLVAALVPGPGARAFASKDVAAREQAEIRCLALNIYHEARGESRAVKRAVAAVTLNRVEDDRFPDTVCEVVWQEDQFSWTADGRSDRPRDALKWREALRLAEDAYRWGGSAEVGDAIFFHHERVHPKWARGLRVVYRAGGHLFY
jgi:spore germination cell wall hydrolase CwlJ-like protein